MEIVHVKLPYERAEVVVLEEAGQYRLREFVQPLHNEGLSVCGPGNNRVILLVLTERKNENGSHLHRRSHTS